MFNFDINFLAPFATRTSSEMLKFEHLEISYYINDLKDSRAPGSAKQTLGESDLSSWLSVGLNHALTAEMQLPSTRSYYDQVLQPCYY